MANGSLSWVNHVDAATLSASSEALPVSNLLIPHRATLWRSTTLTPFLQFDLGSAKAIKVLGLFGSNLSTTATRRWRASNTAFTTGDLLDTSVGGAGVIAGFGQTLHYIAAGITARYVRVDLDDSAKADAATVPWVEVGLAWIGDLWTPTRNFEFGLADQFADPSAQTLTLGGQVYSDVRPAARANAFALPWLTDAESKAQVRQIDQASGLKNNLLWMPNPGGSDMNGESLLGVLTKIAPTVQRAVNVRSRAYEIRERL